MDGFPDAVVILAVDPEGYEYYNKLHLFTVNHG